MTHQLPWLSENDVFPPVQSAWGLDDPLPGLLAAGGRLDADNLQTAYAQGIFPWFSEGQPVLWWSPNPRMALHPEEFRLHRSLRKRLQKFRDDPGCEIRIDSAFRFRFRLRHGAACNGGGEDVDVVFIRQMQPRL